MGVSETVFSRERAGHEAAAGSIGRPRAGGASGALPMNPSEAETTPMDHNTVRRLAFIRYLYQTAISQSQHPVPLCCASLLTMHDAVELFLQLASEHLNVGEDRTPFMGYWEMLAQAIGDELGQKESMRRLNKARVAIKHHGTFPSQLDLEAFRGSTTSFFEDNTPLVFGVAITDVSLIEYVNPEIARTLLKKAEVLLEASDTQGALENLALSFAEMIDDYASRKRQGFSPSPFYFGQDLTSLDSFGMGLGSTVTGLGAFVDRVKESIESMQEAIRILALGLDYRKYSRFRQLIPKVTKMRSGQYHIGGRPSRESVPSVEDVRFCLDFVIECSLALAEFDYTVPAERQTRGQPRG
ncbi:hypothetical protein LCGC14_2552760 [marine sediment metagenome]|uniref:Uncharacterized protein n=1 Tax=marine sediment metagenome TaxID=412755 RepID=A0A0F9AN13_9ZZZZ